MMQAPAPLAPQQPPPVAPQSAVQPQTTAVGNHLVPLQVQHIRPYKGMVPVFNLNIVFECEEKTM